MRVGRSWITAAALVVVALLVAVAAPAGLGDADLQRLTAALALGAPAAGAALLRAAGRPSLAQAATAGAAAYTSGALANHGVGIALAVLGGCALAAIAGGLCSLLGARCDGPAFLVLTLAVALLGGAVVQALPQLTGGEGGLSVPPLLQVSLSDGRVASLSSAGTMHLMLGLATLTALLCGLLLRRGPGPRWRAVGSDRARAAQTGLGPLRAEIGAAMVAAGLAGLNGAVAAHLLQLATPQSFGIEAAALALLAAMAASDPMLAALTAVVTGAAGSIVLPATGYTGPIAPASLALAALAVLAGLRTLPLRRRVQPVPAPVHGADVAWPLPATTGGELRVRSLPVRSGGRGEVLFTADLHATAARVVAIVGPNGAGKTTLLRTIAAPQRPAEVSLTGGMALLDQHGGGFARCTVRETLHLASGGAEGDALAWLEQAGIAPGRLCAALSGGQRRLVDIARVLLLQPSVLLCDEPLAGLDAADRARIIDLLRSVAASGVAVVISEHDRDAIIALNAEVLEVRMLEPEPQLMRATS